MCQAVLFQVAAMVGCADEGLRRIHAMQAGLDAIRAQAAAREAAGKRRPRVFFEEWDEPHISAIRWVSELVGMAGGDDCFPELAVQPMGKHRIIASGDENTSMVLMARGATVIGQRLLAEGRISGVLALGGTMGTDLALDVMNALPLGFPKVLLSTIAYSHLLPAVCLFCGAPGSARGRGRPTRSGCRSCSSS